MNCTRLITNSTFLHVLENVDVDSDMSLMDAEHVLSDVLASEVSTSFAE